MDIPIGFTPNSEDFQLTDFPKTASFWSWNAFRSSSAFRFYSPLILNTCFVAHARELTGVHLTIQYVWRLFKSVMAIQYKYLYNTVQIPNVSRITLYLMIVAYQ